ncbi:MAG: hypothetical protein JWO05_3742 [Gemmatimonadetes bacterium]|nr:hypothetical protein [Gemmatimonadota bacterium]
MLDPRNFLRWVYMGRMSIASAIFIAAVSVWTREDTDTGKLLVASLAFAVTTVATAASLTYSEIYRRQPSATFLYLQSVFDLLLVTAVVHVTGGSVSQFSALYILVIAAATLLLPVGGGLLVAAFGNVLYVADVIWGVDTTLSVAVWLQLAVFAFVALGSAYLSAQLRSAGAFTQELLVQELAHARLQAEEILRNIRSGVLTVDSECRLLYVNPMAEQLLGIDLVEKIGEPILEAIASTAPELAQAIHRSVRERIRTTRAEGIISTVRRRFPVGVTTTYTEGNAADGTGRTATAIFQDISDQKRMESLRLRAERLEGIAELSASLAHEIKNPLASIRSAVEQLSHRPQSGDDEKALMSLVLRESDRLSRLLSEFLDFARVSVTRTSPVDLASLARGAAGLAGAHPDKKEGVRVTCAIPVGIDVTVQGDEDLLHRALFNLLLNAVQASPADGEVKLEVAAVDQQALPDAVQFEGGAISMRVTDQGSGIPAEIRDRLFDPFFTTKPGGSGLGLAIVHRAIEAHQGLVYLDTNPNGSRFTIVLPQASPISPRTLPT